MGSGALAGSIRVQGESAKSRTAAKSMQVVASSRDIMSGCSGAHLYVTSCFRRPFECNSQVWHISAVAEGMSSAQCIFVGTRDMINFWVMDSLC